jgi:hypothetical protein
VNRSGRREEEEAAAGSGFRVLRGGERKCARVITIIWLARRWAASKMGSKNNCNGLANRLLRGRFKPRLAMYLV